MTVLLLLVTGVDDKKIEEKIRGEKSVHRGFLLVLGHQREEDQRQHNARQVMDYYK